MPPETTRRTTLRSRRVLVGGELLAADLDIVDGRIAGIEPHSPRRFEYNRDGPLEDLGELAIFPGLIDSHVHINEPGHTDWEGFASATAAAAAGGITTIIDMPLNSLPVTTTVSALELKKAAARGRCAIDVGFYAGLVGGGACDEELRELWQAGVFGVKAFLCDSGLAEFPAALTDDLERAAPDLARLGIPLLVHAELNPLVVGSKNAGYAEFAASRPPRCEIQALEFLIGLTERFGCRVHVVHLAAGSGLTLLAAARRRALPLSVETCPHYLTFAQDEIPPRDPRYKCAPPIRDAANRAGLISGLLEGTIDWVASDHSPCPPALKGLSVDATASDQVAARFDRPRLPNKTAGHSRSGTGAGAIPVDFNGAWGGISSLQLLLPATWTAMSAAGADLSQLGRWLAAEPARFLGLDRGLQTRGVIAEGNRADLVVWDPEERFVVDRKRLFHRHAITPYDGHELLGVVHRTMLCGQTVFDGERVHGTRGDIVLGPGAPFLDEPEGRC